MIRDTKRLILLLLMMYSNISFAAVAKPEKRDINSKLFLI